MHDRSSCQDYGEEQEEEDQLLPPKVKKISAGFNLATIAQDHEMCKMIYGPLNRSVEITKKDFLVLNPRQYLNDVMILYFLRFLQYYVVPPSDLEKYYIFDP